MDLHDELTNLNQDFANLIEEDKLIDLAKSDGIDLGDDPKSTIAFWHKQGLIPTPIVKISERYGEGKNYYPEITLRLAKYISIEQLQGKSIRQIKKRIEKSLLKILLKSTRSSSRNEH